MAVDSGMFSGMFWILVPLFLSGIAMIIYSRVTERDLLPKPRYKTGEDE